MELFDASDLSSDEKKERIARFCGFEPAEEEQPAYPGVATVKGWRRGLLGPFLSTRELPDYTGDLNAIREAEIKLRDQDPEQFRRYRFIVIGVVNAQEGLDGNPMTASAAQRADAFVLWLKPTLLHANKDS